MRQAPTSEGKEGRWERAEFREVYPRLQDIFVSPRALKLCLDTQILASVQ